MSETKQQLPPVIAKYTWLKGTSGRVFIIVGVWHSADPDNDQVEVIELYRSVPIFHTKAEVKALIASGELSPINHQGKTPAQTS